MSLSFAHILTQSKQLKLKKRKMKEEAKKQLEPISISQIKETLKNISADKFDKMIITDGQTIKRGDYIFAKLKYQKIERVVEKIKFPLFGSIKDNFAELEGGEGKFGEKAHIKSERIFETLDKSYQISSKVISASNINNPFNFPLDASGGEINPKQFKYFFPDQTYQETCSECSGNKYVGCPEEECNSKHEYTCPKCNGHRKVDCRTCNKSGYLKCDNCKGRGEYKCSKCAGKGEIKCGSGFLSSGCGGSGYVKNAGKEERCKKCNGRGYSPCSECRNGIIRCAKCSAKGEIRCNDCSGKGEVDCRYCDAAGKIICVSCYGDKDRYGMIDCPTCKTIGIMGQIVFVESLVTENETEKIILKGEKLNITESTIQKHITSNVITETVYKKVNDDVAESYDEFSKEYAETFEKELNLNKDCFPLLTKEEIYYQIVPCVELSYKHVLTNTSHEFTIIDFFSKPEVIFHSEPEQLKQDLGNATKAVGGFLGKLFKTKGFKTKEDKRNEIVLLIHLVKVDGKIEDEEKVYLSEMISSLDDFTNSEKQKLFDIMNSVTLPELTKVDVTFSSNERGQEVLSKLIKLAIADGEINDAEKALIDKIKKMM